MVIFNGLTVRKILRAEGGGKTARKFKRKRRPGKMASVKHKYNIEKPAFPIEEK